MPYTLKDHDAYILLEFYDKTYLKENEQARDELAAFLEHKVSGLILVDMSKADLSEVSLNDLVDFGKGWEDFPHLTNSRFATLIPENNPFRAKIDLSLTVGLDQGIELKIFESRNLAIDWLAPESKAL